MMKARSNRAARRLAAITAAALCIAGAMTLHADDTGREAAAASLKEETIYAVLTAEGMVSGIYAVNAFEAEGAIVDYGRYTAVENLTDTAPLQYEGNVVRVEPEEAGRFVYRGTVEADMELPWTIAVSYALDGEEMTAEEIAGQSGRLRCGISITRNAAYTGDFYDTMTLQTTVTLQAAEARNIQAEGGVLATAGGNKTISFTTLPGTDGAYAVEADVTRFAMPGISIGAVRMTMDLSGIDLSAYTAGFGQLTDGLSQLSAQSGALTGGAGQLVDGIIESAGAQLSAALSGYGVAVPPMTRESYKATLEALRETAGQFPDPAMAAGLLASLEATETMLDSAVAFYEGVAAYTGAVDVLAGAASGIDLEEQLGQGMAEAVGGGDYTPKSFLSEENRVRAIQFVLRTEPIQLPEPERAAIETSAPKSFWERLTGIFRSDS